MHWNYRIVRKTEEFGGRVHVTYAIHEVHYNEDGSIWAVTEDPVSLYSVERDFEEADALESLMWTLNTILRDIKKHPILEEPIDFVPHEADLEEGSEESCNAPPAREKE